MYSLSIDYIFNRVYDVLLWIKFVWLFVFLRNDKDAYLEANKNVSWDGLRDRGWFDSFLANKSLEIPQPEVHMSLWQKMLESFGFKLPDSDGDGIPDVRDSSPYDAKNLTGAQLKERYEEDYSFFDHVRDIFGIGPKDTDGDGVPDSYESKHNMDPKNPDSDRDGTVDGEEIVLGTDPLNNDTDHDGVIDGRDESPLDGNTSSISVDTDGDGVSDRIEKILGTNINDIDTDQDGITDNMDTYPLDPNNISQISPFDISKSVDGISFHIQNPVLSLLADFMSILALVFILVLVYSATMWFISHIKAYNHFDHHFEGEHKNHGLHEIKDNSTHSGVENLPIMESAVSAPPTVEDFKVHPRFAIIQGYMSSNSEALWRIGILEAENMMEEVLRDKGYKGENMSELLRTANFQTVNLAWAAHKTRNRIAHDGSNFTLTEREAKETFVMYESVFKELKVIR